MKAKALRIGKAISAALFVLLLVAAGTKNALAQSTVGTDFWVTFLPNDPHDNGEVTMSLIAAGSTPCTGIISNPNTNWSTNFEVSVGATTIINIPLSACYSLYDSDCILNTGLHVVSTDSISLYASNFMEYSFDVTDVLPTPTLGSNYVLQTYTGEEGRGTMVSRSPYSKGLSHQYAEFSIIAVEDNTTVYITLTCNSQNGHYANEPFSVTLNAGQCYQVQSIADGDFSGSQVTVSDNKKVAVFAGNSCTNVPSNCSACDHIVEQMMPVSNWGNHFVVTGSSMRTYDVVRVTALNNDCQIFINNSLVSTIGERQIYQFDITSDNPSLYIETSEPAMVYLYFSGGYCGGSNGDPSMVIISPIEQRMDNVTFSTFNSGTSQYHFVNVVANTNEVAYIQLDGNSIASEFQLVPGNPVYSFARVSIQHGSHTLSTSGDGFVAHVYGLGSWESYAYSVGSRTKNLSTQMIINGQLASDFPDGFDICKGETVNFDINANFEVTHANWNFGDGQTGSGSSILHQYNVPGDYVVSCDVYKLKNGQDTLVATVTSEVHVHNLYHIMATADPSNGGIVSGGGTYCQGATATLTAVANEGYTFTNWTENSVVVSMNTTYSFIVSSNRNLVANFTNVGTGGMLNGMFSVSNNKKVCFSQGNLQYRASTDTWRFATNQYDRIGEDNANISQTYNGWIDLFGWGTSGYDHGAVCYQPWSTSLTNNDYYVYGCDTCNLFDQTGQADWGYNAISNGGNQPNYWRTLTSAEWNYVLNYRTTTSGIRYARSQVNSINGLILLPDNWNTSTYSLNNTNTPDASFSSNIVSIAQWSVLENAGAVFLPVTGGRNGTSVIWVDERGQYWTSRFSTYDSSIYAVGLSFGITDNNYIGFFADWRCSGHAVRLVRDVITQTTALTPGWNWYSTYIEQEGIDGLGQLENSIGVPKAIIQSQGDGYVKSILRNGRILWGGALSSINNEEMYKIGTKYICEATMEGVATNPAEHPITINKGWNWIGFPCSQSVSVNVALSGFTPKNNDVIKGIHSYATYSNGTWSGTLNTLEPGQGYMYGSKNRTPKTLVFQTGRGEATIANITPENNFFQPSEDYADNMTLIAVINLDGEELRSDDYELAAFVGDECRGSVKLMYVEPIDRYIAFLTVFGDYEEDMRFVLTNGESMNWSDDPLTFAVDGMSGTLTEPTTLRFGTSVQQDYVNIFPNPSNGVFNIEGKGIRKVSVINAYGQIILSKEVANDLMQIDLNGKAAGVYMLQIVTDNGIMTRQLIKK